MEVQPFSVEERGEEPWYLLIRPAIKFKEEGGVEFGIQAAQVA